MADETSSPPALAPVARAVIVVFAFVAMLLAAAIAVVAITQVGSAAAAQGAAASAQLVRLDVERLRQDAKAKDLLLTDLATRVQADAMKVTAGFRALGDVDARIQEDITRASGQQKHQTELASVAQQGVTDKLTHLTERIEELRTEVVVKEAKALQDQIADSQRRIAQVENEVSALKQALEAADIPGLKARAQEVDREIVQVSTDLKALTTTSEAFRVQVTKASEAFRAQVTEFFQHVLYNDPWSKYTPEASPPGPP